MNNNTKIATFRDYSSIGVTTVYFLSFIILGVVTGTHGPSIPQYSNMTDVSIESVSIVFSSISAGHLLGSYVASRLYDKFRGHITIAIALILMSICLYSSALVTSLYMLVLFTFGIGLAKSAINVGCNTLLVWVQSKAVAPYMNALHFFFGFGAFLGPLIVTYSLSKRDNISWGFLLLGIITFAVAIWCFYLKSPTAPEKEMNSHVENSSPYFAFLLITIIFLYVGTEVSFGGWIYTYAEQMGIADTQTKGYLTSSFWGSLTVTRLIMMPLVSRVRPQIILIGSFLFGLLSLSIIIYFNSIAGAFTGTIGLGVGMASIFPTIVVLAQNRLSITGRFMGNLSIGASLGAMLIPWIVGQYIVNNPPSFLWLSLLTLLVALIILSLALIREKRINN